MPKTASRSYLFILTLLLLLISCKKSSSVKSVNEKLLLSLDQKIKEKKQYEDQKKRNILALKRELTHRNDNDSITYAVNDRIAEEYLGYQCDSAFVYIDRNKDLATKADNTYWKHRTLLQRSVMLSTIGLFVESKEILDQINPATMPQNLRFEYNSAYECLYSNLYDYNGGDNYYGKLYRSKLVNYYEYAYRSLKPSDPFYYLFLSHLNRINNHWKESNDNIDAFLKTTKPGTRLYAIGSFCKAVIEAKLGNVDSQERCLIISAISDIESSTKENRSMQDLANILYLRGDSERSYRYIQSALEDANFYNARFRSIQISKVQPIIEETYLHTINRQNQKLLWSVFAISILVAGLGAAMYFVYKQLQTITKSRNELEQTNHQLKVVNSQLDEANHIKEEYIAFFINQCSTYIEKFDRYKKIISRRLSVGQMDKVLDMVNNKNNNEMDLAELYQNFDRAFLRIYPNFVQEINKLIKPDAQYQMKSGTLNTELRIFALIRLGINDTNQISEFLRYSLRTIYNYRSRVKAKSVIENDDFEAKIMEIGSISTT
ncbi:MAG: hypothetical protein BGO40_05485 [Chryseobacterium sp. 39-10]|nr:MAG: hypothetical protein BGO40_05485 [Chryseobacterium sp. 39-10]